MLEKDLEIFWEIADKEEHENLTEFIDRVKAVLTEEDEYYEKIIRQTPNSENISAIIYSYMILGKDSEAAIALFEMNESIDASFTYTVLNIENNAEIASSIMLNILKNGEHKPEYYFALSLIHENLGQLSDSYSAICLALEKWPEEYEWENIAGILSTKMGNNRSAQQHFRNAEIYNSQTKYTDQIGLKSIKTIGTLSVEDLEKLISISPKDLTKILRIANALVEKKRLDDAIYFIKQGN